MKLTISKAPKHYCGRHSWEWLYTKNGQFMAGGYCATKKAAESDAAIWLKARKKEGAL